MTGKLETDKYTLISLAEVRDTFDPDRNGTFTAKVFSLGNSEELINYVSPYGTGREGGFIAIPEIGTTVLVCRPAGGTEFYYLGCTFISEPLQAEGATVAGTEIKPAERVDARSARARGVPLRINLKGARGGGLLIAEEYNQDFYNVKTEISSPEGKIIKLTDSPGQDNILLSTENNSKITLQGDTKYKGKLGAAAHSIQMESMGPQKLICGESSIDILVNDGREINVLNNSVGDNKPYGPPENEYWGNVNVQSKWRDVNVFSNAESGRIFIECTNEGGSDQVIEIQTNGEDGAIRIKTNGKVDISAKNIDLEAVENINIKAGEEINFEAASNMGLRCTGGNINADAVQIHLNDGINPVADTDIGQTDSYYGNTGVTTY